ncbi:MAG: hypothetical protein NT121_22675 [Chloroflexi bacterium]|nr:hypothetical protein [Chloroflexota bacterium]
MGRDDIMHIAWIKPQSCDLSNRRFGGRGSYAIQLQNQPLGPAGLGEISQSQSGIDQDQAILGFQQ